MLFDLQSPRRRMFIKVVYSTLALLLGGGLILFGIGGGVSGGLLDAIGLTDSSGSSAASGFDDQIAAAEKKLQVNPQDPAALLEVARLHFLAGQSSVEVDPETGGSVPTEDSKQQFTLAADSWSRYLKLKPTPPSSEVAALMAQAYVALAETATTANDALINVKGAAAAQQILADAMPSLGSFSNLALYLYFAGDTAAADEAAKKAEGAAESAQKAQVIKQLAAFKEQAAKFQQQVKDANKQASSGAPGQNPLEEPSGGLSGGGLGGSSLGGP